MRRAISVSIQVFRQQLNDPNYKFATTLDFVNQHYNFQPTAFINGDIKNAKGQNGGSCKVIAMALLEGLSDQEVLMAFGEHYRSVLATPNGNDHQNIRALQKKGLCSVVFDQFPVSRLNNS